MNSITNLEIIDIKLMMKIKQCCYCFFAKYLCMIILKTLCYIELRLPILRRFIIL